MGIFDSLFKPDTGPTSNAYGAQKDYVRHGEEEALDTLKSGLKKGAAPLNQAADIYSQFGQQFQPGVDMYLNSLGLMGPAGNQAAVNAFQTGPGYQFALSEGDRAADRFSVNRGNWNSGNALDEYRTRSMGLANQEYGNWQNRLSGLINPSFQGMSGQAGVLQDLSNLFEGNYNNRANVNLGAASNLANTAGQYGQNMQAANTAATENFWNLVQGMLGAGAKVGGAYMG